MADLAELNLVINSTQVKAANNDLKVMIEIGGKVEGVMKNAGNTASSTSGIVGKLGQSYRSLYSILATVAAGAGAVGAALKAVQLAGQQEMRMVGFTTLLKDGEKARVMLDDLRKFANETPFEFAGLADTSKKMLAVGFSAKTLIADLTSIGNATSALGGGADLMDRIVIALGQMGMKAKLSQEEINQLTDAGIDAKKYVADAFNVTKEGLQLMIDAGEVTGQKAKEAILRGMDKEFKGGMAAQSKTLLGMFSSLKDEIATVMTDLGSTISEALDLKGVIGRATEWVKRYGGVFGEMIRLAAGMAPKHKELAQTAKEWLDFLKGVGVILGVIFGVKMLATVTEMAVKLNAMRQAFAGMTLTSAPLLAVVLAIGVGLSTWAVSETLIGKLKTMQGIVNGISNVFEQATDPAGARGGLPLTDKEAADLKFRNEMRGKVHAANDKLIADGADPQFNQMRDAGYLGNFANGLSGVGDTVAKALSGVFPQITKEIKESSKALEDLTSKQKEADEVMGPRRDSAAIFVGNLKKEQEALEGVTFLQSYYNDLKKVGQTLNSEYNGDSAKIAERLDTVKAAINEYEAAKALKGVREDISLQQREQNILATKFGDERERALMLEGQVGKAQAAGIKFSDEQIEKLKKINAELQKQKQRTEEVDRATGRIADAFGNFVSDSITKWGSWKDAALNMIQQVEQALLDLAVIEPIKKAATSFLGPIISGAFGGGTTTVEPHAAGGLVTSPTFFNFNGNRTGVAGERGSEFIMPAVRGPDGKLGVAAQGGGGQNVTHNHYWNITTPNADSFRKSGRQVASEMQRRMGRS